MAHLQPHPEMGHSGWSANQSVMCLAWPPCLHVWHHVKAVSNGVTFLSPFAGRCVLSIRPECVPIDRRQTAHRGRSLRHCGHACTLMARLRVACLVKVEMARRSGLLPPMAAPLPTHDGSPLTCKKTYTIEELKIPQAE